MIRDIVEVKCCCITNDSLSIIFRLSSDAEILLIIKLLTEHTNWCQMCKNVYALCIHILTELPVCIPLLVAGCSLNYAWFFFLRWNMVYWQVLPYHFLTCKTKNGTNLCRAVRGVPPWTWTSSCFSLPSLSTFWYFFSRRRRRARKRRKLRWFVFAGRALIVQRKRVSKVNLEKNKWYCTVCTMYNRLKCLPCVQPIMQKKKLRLKFTWPM